MSSQVFWCGIEENIQTEGEKKKKKVEMNKNYSVINWIFIKQKQTWRS